MTPTQSEQSDSPKAESGFCSHCGVPVLPGQPTGSCGRDNDLLIGNAAIARMGRDCCGKPKGCTNMNPGCAYLNHPYKRWVRGEITLEELEAVTAPVHREEGKR